LHSPTLFSTIGTATHRVGATSDRIRTVNHRVGTAWGSHSIASRLRDRIAICRT
jgi:hypothetical protein